VGLAEFFQGGDTAVDLVDGAVSFTGNNLVDLPAQFLLDVNINYRTDQNYSHCHYYDDEYHA